MDEKKIITLDGKEYVWTGNYWYEASSFVQPPEVAIRRLNELVKAELAREDANITNV